MPAGRRCPQDRAARGSTCAGSASLAMCQGKERPLSDHVVIVFGIATCQARSRCTVADASVTVTSFSAERD